MGTRVEVALCGVYNENPLSYLVFVDGFNFLIDCGWNDHFDTSLLDPLRRVASTVDVVLLSHPDTLHLGALPYAAKHFKLRAPVFATGPVVRLGLFLMYDHYLSRNQLSDFDLFTLGDIDDAFKTVTTLTYSHNYHMPDLKKNIENMEKNSVTSLRTLVNIGSKVYSQADVPDTRHIFVDVGLGFFVEFTWSEALHYIKTREEIIEKQIEEYTRLIASIKARIKLVCDGIRKLLDLPTERTH